MTAVLIVLVGVCLVLDSVVAGLATGEVQAWLKLQSWYSARVVWLLLGVAVVLSVGVVIWQRRLGDSPERVRGIRSEADFQRNRRQLIQRVRTDWVEGVLNRSLYKVARIELGLETKPDAVDRPLDVVVRRPDRESQSLPLGTPIISVYDGFEGQLLILGDPGTGKTTLLLELARDLLDRTQKDEYHPVPVVFNLSSWAKERPPLVEWLAHDLNRQISDIPAKTWRVWLETDRILPLLDGLDEVALEHREECVARINDFRRQKARLPFVVCSRTRDYGSLDAKLEMPGAAEVQPLKPERVAQFLEQAGEPVAEVRAALQGDATLWEVLDTPFMFNIAMLAYQGASAGAVRLSGTLEERRAMLFAKYIDAAFKRRTNEGPYDRDQTIHCLGWLAKALVRQGQTIFHLESLQPNWLGLRSSRVGGLGTGLIFGLMGGLMGGLIVGDGLRPADTMRFSWAKTRNRLGVRLFGWLIFGLIGGLAFGLVVDLAFGLVFGLVVVVLVSLDDALVTGEIATRSGANEGTHRSLWQWARTVLLFGLVFGLVGGLIGGLVGGLSGGLVGAQSGGGWGLLAGLFCALEKGGAFFIQHWVLRFLLWRKRFAPLRYVRFLDHAAEHVFLRKVGGGYIFIHRMLMEHFAKLYESETRAASKAQSAAA